MTEIYYVHRLTPRTNVTDRLQSGDRLEYFRHLPTRMQVVSLLYYNKIQEYSNNCEPVWPSGKVLGW